MRLLLDTHIFLWCIQGESKRIKSIRSKLSHASEIYVSSASIWEMTIKIKLNKLEGDISAIVAAISESGFLELPITSAHAAAVSGLPDIHRDPFDRMLIAQAILEPLTLLTADVLLKQYTELVQVL